MLWPSHSSLKHKRKDKRVPRSVETNSRGAQAEKEGFYGALLVT